MKLLLRLLIRGYQVLISPALSCLTGCNSKCRYEPSCSHYYLQALEIHGAAYGTLLGLKRIGRCHPWGGGGLDPVPPARSVGARKIPAVKLRCSH